MFTAKDVMALREMSGAGMMDCKRALVETDGDMDKAMEYLREKSLAATAKKASRIAAEGIVDSYIHMGGKIGVLLEVNCETDFVAKTDDFKQLVHDIAMHIAASNPTYITKEEVDQAEIEHEKKILREQAMNEPKPKPAAIIEKMVEGRIEKYYKEVCLLEQPFVKDPDKTVGEMVSAAIAKIGEKISVRRFARYHSDNGVVDSYIHMGGKVGVLIEAEGEMGENAAEVIHDCALQIAAASPVAPEYVRREEVRADHLEHEKEILIAQARNEGKPEKIIEKMVEGRIKKFYQEVCLLDQLFVKDGEISVQTMINQKAKGLTIVRFTRYKMGDGLEKKVNDLAAEVAEQAAKMGL